MDDVLPLYNRELEFLRRQATTQLLERILDRTFTDVAADAAALADPAVRNFVVRDIQALCARSIRGFAAEHAVYANGWEPPADLPDIPWTLGLCTDQRGIPQSPWLRVPRLRTVEIAGAGVLPQFTHPDDVIGLIAPS